MYECDSTFTRKVPLIPFSNTDIAIVVFYMMLVLGVGFYYAQRRQETSTDYFLAGRNVGWFAIGVSIFAANISSEHFIGLAGHGASRGWAIGNFEWMAIIFILALGWFLAPLILRSGVFTMPEFLGRRFDGRVRSVLSTISIIAYILTKITITLYAGGLLLEKVFGIDILVSAVILVVITGLYTIVGGMSSVIYTSVVQGIFLIAGAAALTITGFVEIGGWEGLQSKLPESYFVLFNPASDPELPWTGMLIGAPILAIWYWWTDQFIVQRIMTARDVQAARRGTILTGFLKILPVFLLVLPGLIAAVMFPGIRGDEAFAALFMGSLLPVGIRGLVLAGVLAALMSSLAAVFNTTATLFTMDFYKRYRPAASERELVLIGRLATTTMVITAILWMPLSQVIGAHLFMDLQSFQAFISPPIVAVFILGLTTKFVTERGALWALLFGEAIGVWRLVVGATGAQPAYLGGLATMNFLHFDAVLFVFSSLVAMLVSLMSMRTEHDTFPGFYKMGYAVNAGSIRASTISRNDLYLSATLIIVLVGLWGSFI
jgi:SSS family solute:Na+ symporter